MRIKDPHKKGYEHLRKVNLSIQSWNSQAACRNLSLDSFYDVEDKNLKRNAAKYCVNCPVQQKCLYTAIVNDDHHGLWGGLTPRQRKAFSRKVRLSALYKKIDTSIWNEEYFQHIFENCSYSNALDILS